MAGTSPAMTIQRKWKALWPGGFANAVAGSGGKRAVQPPRRTPVRGSRRKSRSESDAAIRVGAVGLLQALLGSGA
jgi:hypothetical protein